MPIPVTFRKDRILEILHAIAAGEIIEPESDRGWSQTDLITLAGVAMFGAMTHGPAELSDADWDQLPDDRRVSGEEAFLTDLPLAVQFACILAKKIQDGDYDQAYGPMLMATVFDDDGQAMVAPIEGFK